MVLLLVGLGIMMSITNGKRVQIEQVRKEVSQVTKTQKHVTTQIDNLQTTYNANDAKAKSRLLEFAKAIILLVVNQIMISDLIKYQIF